MAISMSGTNVVAILVITGFTVDIAAGQQTNMGTEFWFVFLDTCHGSGDNMLWLTPASNTAVSVNISFQDTSGTARVVTEVVPIEGKTLVLPGSPRVGVDALSQPALHLRASSPIAAIALTTDVTFNSTPSLHQEAALLLPVSALGSFYITAPSNSLRTTFVAVVPTKNDTRVRVFQFSSVTSPVLVADVTLQTGQIYWGGLGTTLVAAGAPVAVFVGSCHADNFNHFYQQVVPVQAWGSTYVAYGYGINGILWVLPQGNTTFLAADGTAKGSSRTVVTGYPKVSNMRVVQTDKPVSTIRWENPADDGTTVPCRVDIVAKENWLTGYRFYIGQSDTDLVVVFDIGNAIYVKMNGKAISTSDCVSVGSYQQCIQRNEGAGLYTFSTTNNSPMAVYIHRQDATSAICAEAGAGLGVLNQHWVDPCPTFYAGTTSISGLEVPLETLCPTDPVVSSSSSLSSFSSSFSSPSSASSSSPSSFSALFSSSLSSFSSSFSSCSFTPADDAATFTPSSPFTDVSASVDSISATGISYVVEPTSSPPDVLPSATETVMPSPLNSVSYGSKVSSTGLQSASDFEFLTKESTGMSDETVITATPIMRSMPVMTTPASQEETVWTERAGTEVCSCSCLSQSLGIDSAVADRDRIYASVKENLLVDRMQTTVYKRKYKSVPDGRTLSKVLGTGGILVLCSCLACILLPDLISLIRYFTATETS